MMMKDRGPRLVLPLMPAIVIAALAVSPVHAASHPSSHLVPHGFSVLWIMLALLGVVPVALVRLSRRGSTATLLSLAFLVALFGFQTAVHSVHHLSDPHAAASCAIFAASQHVPGDCPEVLLIAAPIWTAAPCPAIVSEPFHSLEAFGSPEGRAPPAPSSV